MRRSGHATFGARFVAGAIIAVLAACTDRQSSPASQSAAPAPAGPQVAASNDTPAAPGSDARSAAPQTALPPSRPMPPDAHPLACGLAGFERNITREKLVAVFGANNVSDMRNEEEGFGSIVLFAHDPRRELEIRFAPAPAGGDGRIAESVEVSGPDSTWVLNGQFRMGDSLETAEQYNGQTFTLFGLVSNSWQGGAMEKPDCAYWVNFSEPGPATDAREYRSDDPALRARRLSIVRFGFSWIDN
jgi:hypothetical protein